MVGSQDGNEASVAEASAHDTEAPAGTEDSGAAAELAKPSGASDDAECVPFVLLSVLYASAASHVSAFNFVPAERCRHGQTTVQRMQRTIARPTDHRTESKLQQTPQWPKLSADTQGDCLNEPVFRAVAPEALCNVTSTATPSQATRWGKQSCNTHLQASLDRTGQVAGLPAGPRMEHRRLQVCMRPCVRFANPCHS